MTNITSLPKEIFQKIIKDLEPNDVQRCQKVCKAWYRPFHLQVLNKITLYGAYKIEDFVFAIDNNPDPTYLDAVKSIRICDDPELAEMSESDDEYDEYPHHAFDTEAMFCGMFFRFRNLQQVVFSGEYWIVSKFNDTLCRKFLESCTKLDKFLVEYPERDLYNDDVDDQMQQVDHYYGCLRHVQPLLTHMDATQLSWYTRFNDSSVGYVTQFPRLEKIFNASTCFTNFWKWLHVLEKLPDYQHIAIQNDDKINLAESYLITNKEKQTKLLKTLSKVRDFTLLGTLEDSIVFATMYLTGLESFTSTNNYPFYHFGFDNWDSLRIERYCNNLWDLVATTKISSYVSLKRLEQTFLSTNLSTITRKVFHSIESTSSVNSLRLFIKDANYEEANSTELTVTKKSNNNRIIDISLKHDTNIDDIASTFFTAQLNNVTSFELELKNRKKKDFTTIDAFDKILMRMPTLHRLILDIPTSFRNGGKPKIEYCLKLVQDVTIRANTVVDMGTLFNRIHHVFPNIKQLEIYYYSGIWNPHAGEFDLSLPNYTLERLTVDLSPIRNMSLKHLASQIPLDDHFFVLNVTNNGVKHMYQVPLDFSSVAKVEDDDLLGFECGTDFYQFNITIQNIHYLHLYLNYVKYPDENNADYKNTMLSSYSRRDESKTLVIAFVHRE